MALRWPKNRCLRDIPLWPRDQYIEKCIATASLQENLGKVRSSIKGLYTTFSLDIENEKGKVVNLTNILKSLKAKCSDKDDVERSLETALEVSENYKLQFQLLLCSNDHLSLIPQDIWHFDNS